MTPTLEQFREASAKEVAQFYADIPYHNLQHAKSVEKYAMEIAQNIGLDTAICMGISQGGRAHDTLYHQPLAPGFATKEDVSIFVSNKIIDVLAVELNIDPELVTMISTVATDAIEATKLDCQDFSSEPRKIMRSADVQHLGTADLEQFMRDTALIYHEYALLNKQALQEKGRRPLPVDLFQAKQAEILESFHDVMKLHIPESPYLPERYYANFFRNIQSLKSIDFKAYL